MFSFLKRIRYQRPQEEFFSIQNRWSIASFADIDLRFSEYGDELVEMIADSGMVLRGFFVGFDGLVSFDYVKFSNLTRYPRHLKKLVDLIIERLILDQVEFDAILVSETAASCLATTLAHFYGKGRSDEVPVFFARTNKRGLPFLIVNPGKDRHRVLLVDDVPTSLENLSGLRKLARKEGYPVVGNVIFATQGCSSEEFVIDGEYFLKVVDFKTRRYSRWHCPPRGAPVPISGLA